MIPFPVMGHRAQWVPLRFTMLDKNKNGEIDKTEQEEAMKNIHSMTLPKARWAWSAMDTDGDGKISESEFLKGMLAISDKVGDCLLYTSPSPRDR